MDQKIKAGDRVANPSMPAWGEGRVIEVKAENAVVVFDAQPNMPKTVRMNFLVRSGEGRGVLGPLFRKTYERTYPASMKRAFMDGSLVDALAAEFPFLYDEDDIRLAKGSQGKSGNHFCEWYAAKFLHELTGYHVLVEKAEVPSHKRKAEVLKKLMTQSAIDFICQQNKPFFGNSQCPDLLIYAPDFSDWYFCEVKGPGDNLRDVQERYFQELKVRFGKPIDLIDLREVIG